MAQLALCQICFWVLIGAGEYNCLWFFRFSLHHSVEFSF